MRFEITFGVGFDRNGNPLDSVTVREGIKYVLSEAALAFGGCNLVNGQGAWISPSGTLVVEETHTLIMDGDDVDEDKATRIARSIRRVFNQEAVHFAVVAVAHALISDQPHVRRLATEETVSARA